MTLVRMPLQGGASVLIEAADDFGSRQVGGKQTIKQASQSLQEALSTVQPAAQAVLDQFEGMRPAKISMQFAIKVTGEANVAIAKTGGEANFTVSVEWNPAEGSKAAD